MQGGTDARSPALEIAADATPELTGNVFVGYREIAGVPEAVREQLRNDNYMVPAPERTTPKRRGP